MARMGRWTWPLLAFTPAAAMANGQGQAAAAACSSGEYRQLDFWVGDWIATWSKPDGTTGTGRNRITRDEYGSCVITEHFTADDGSMKGHSVSTYLAPAREWRQTWVDDQGGYFDLVGGPLPGAGQRFYFETFRRHPSAPFARMVWEDVTRDKFTWRWQKKAGANDSWSDSWVIRYTRAP